MVCAEGVFGAVGYAEGGSVGEGWGGLMLGVGRVEGGGRRGQSGGEEGKARAVSPSGEIK